MLVADLVGGVRRKIIDRNLKNRLSESISTDVQVGIMMKLLTLIFTPSW